MVPKLSDTDGTVVADFEDTFVLSSPNGSWLAGGELLLVREEDFQLSAVRVTDGNIRRLGPVRERLIAVMGDRLVWHSPQTATSPLALTTSTIEGNDTRPFVTASPARDLLTFNVARDLRS